MVSGQKSVNFYKWFTQRRRSQVMSVTRTTNTENGHLLCLYRNLFIENFGENKLQCMFKVKWYYSIYLADTTHADHNVQTAGQDTAVLIHPGPHDHNVCRSGQYSVHHCCEVQSDLLPPISIIRLVPVWPDQHEAITMFGVISLWRSDLLLMWSSLVTH